MKILRLLPYFIIAVAIVTFSIWMFTSPRERDTSRIFINPDYVYTLEDENTYTFTKQSMYTSYAFDLDIDTTIYLKEEDCTKYGWVLMDKGDKLSYYTYDRGEYVMVIYYSKAMISKSGKGKQPVVLFYGKPETPQELYTIMRQVGIVNRNIQ